MKSATAIPTIGARITLRDALITLGALLVVINVGSAVWDAYVDRERTELRAQRDFSNLSSLLAEQTAMLLEAVDLVLRDVARDGIVVRNPGWAPRLSDEMSHIPQVAAFLVLDAGGHVVARTNDMAPVDTVIAGRPCFTAHRDGLTKGLFFSAPYRTATNGKWRFAMSRRIETRGGRFAGVVVAAMELETFDNLYRAIDLGSGRFITLRSHEGVVITRVPDPTGARGRQNINLDIDAGIRREGRFAGWTTSPILNEPVLLTASAVRGFSIQVVTGATEQAVFAPWHREASRIAARTVLTCSVMLTLIALAAWGLAQREQALKRERELADAERELADAERARFEQRLRQAEKMEAVGRLAGGIAHDFNNILGGILGYGEMLFEQTAETSPLKRYALNVLTAAKRARGLVDQILAYSRNQHGTRVAVDFGRVVAETLELIRGSLGPGLHFEAELPAAPLFVIGDPTQLHQILMNLCTNAIQAMDKAGTLRVALKPVHVSTERALTHRTLQAGSYLRLTVADTGSGMDQATIARIFEPFFTTKEVSKGTGLGLSLVYGIVTDSGGGIDVTSAPGRGSTFTIYFPRADADAEDSDENQEPVPLGNGERVLVVDDEELLVSLTSEALQRFGYEPVGFTDSRAALAAFESGPERFDAAVTDELMPGITGTELVALLHRRRADLPIVLVSGYIGAPLADKARGAGVTEILKKPVQSREIAEALAHALRRASSTVHAPH